MKFLDKTIPSVVYPRLMQPQMLQLSIRVLSERLTYGFYITGQPYHTRLVPIGRIGEEALRLGINNTKTLFKITAFPYWDRD